MFAETDLLPISALQHLAFCERQWALIHLEGIWAENRLTVEGNVLHERADTPGTEVRGRLRIARGLRLRSLQLGLVGIADVVEFHRIDEGKVTDIAAPGLQIENVAGQWRAEPVEYKRGKPKTDYCDEVQLCAQALCLEEMLEVSLPLGSLYYGQPHQRFEIVFDDPLRNKTRELITKLHDLNHAGRTPQVQYKRKCESCSLLEHCMPKITGNQRSARGYFSDALIEITQE